MHACEFLLNGEEAIHRSITIFKEAVKIEG